MSHSEAWTTDRLPIDFHTLGDRVDADDIRRDHVGLRVERWGGRYYCRHDSQLWPCQMIRALGELDVARGEVGELRSALTDVAVKARTFDNDGDDIRYFCEICRTAWPRGGPALHQDGCVLHKPEETRHPWETNQDQSFIDVGVAGKTIRPVNDAELIRALLMKIEGQDGLLRAYRLSSQPTEKTFHLLERARKIISRAKAGGRGIGVADEG